MSGYTFCPRCNSYIGSDLYCSHTCKPGGIVTAPPQKGPWTGQQGILTLTPRGWVPLGGVHTGFYCERETPTGECRKVEQTMYEVGEYIVCPAHAEEARQEWGEREP